MVIKHKNCNHKICIHISNVTFGSKLFKKTIIIIIVIILELYQFSNQHRKYSLLLKILIISRLHPIPSNSYKQNPNLRESGPHWCYSPPAAVAGLTPSLRPFAACLPHSLSALFPVSTLWIKANKETKI